MKQFRYTAFTFLFISAFIVGNSQTEWKLEKSGKGVTVHTREVPETSIKEFKAQVVINANIELLIKAIREVEHHPEWMYMVKSAETLNAEPEVLQYDMKVPFPFTDRYVVMRSKYTSDTGMFRLDMDQSDHSPHNVEDMIQVEYVKGFWLFTSIDDNTTSVLYQFVSDPGGNIPDWVVNSFIVKNPYQTLQNLRKRVE